MAKIDHGILLQTRRFKSSLGVDISILSDLDYGPSKTHCACKIGKEMLFFDISVECIPSGNRQPWLNDGYILRAQGAGFLRSVQSGRIKRFYPRGRPFSVADEYLQRKKACLAGRNA